LGCHSNLQVTAAHRIGLQPSSIAHTITAEHKATVHTLVAIQASFDSNQSTCLMLLGPSSFAATSTATIIAFTFIESALQSSTPFSLGQSTFASSTKLLDRLDPSSFVAIDSLASTPQSFIAHPCHPFLAFHCRPSLVTFIGHRLNPFILLQRIPVKVDQYALHLVASCLAHLHQLQEQEAALLVVVVLLRPFWF